MFKSGNSDHPGDRFLNTTVEVFPIEQPMVGSKLTEDGFVIITKFDQDTGK